MSYNGNLLNLFMDIVTLAIKICLSVFKRDGEGIDTLGHLALPSCSLEVRLAMVERPAPPG